MKPFIKLSHLKTQLNNRSLIVFQIPEQTLSYKLLVDQARTEFSLVPKFLNPPSTSAEVCHSFNQRHVSFSATSVSLLTWHHNLLALNSSQRVLPSVTLLKLPPSIPTSISPNLSLLTSSGVVVSTTSFFTLER